MKTPKDLLLGRHRSIQPKLDAIRAQVVEELRREEDRADASPVKPNFWLKIWREIVLPARPIWLGSAVAWCLILTLHSLEPTTKSVIRADVPRPSLEMIAVLQYPDSSAVADLKPAWKDKVSGPRSEAYLEEGKS